MTELAKPSLNKMDDPVLKWVWWRGLTYLAGFQTREAAILYGKGKGWIDKAG